jgi:hypothetical protein
MVLKGVRYYADNSDLEVVVLNIPYCNSEYGKIKIAIYYKNIIVEKPRYYKIYWNNIKHWKIKESI